MTRRELLAAIPAAAFLPLGRGRTVRAQQAGQGSPARFATRALNHVTLTVTDPKRSLAFYQKVFGLPVVATQGPVPILRIGSGPQFLALSGGPGATPRIDHFCLTIDDFDATRVMKALEAHGVTAAGQGGGLAGGPLRARIRVRDPKAGGAPEGTPELYFGDPDGITVQLQAATYCGGAGTLGERCSTDAKASSAPFVTREMNHVTLMVTDVKRSLEFYQKVFGLPVVATQGPTQIMRVGKGPSFVALGGGPQVTARIDHVCLTVEKFDVNRIMTALDGLGIKRVDQPAGKPQPPLTARVRMRGADFGGAKEGTPELYFTDPDGISIQLQDPTYCGGAGVLGEVCKG